MRIRELMTPNPITLQASTPVIEAARAMRQHNVGDVVVRKDGKPCGIVTDRDIVVRVLGEGRDPTKTDLDAICSHELSTVSPDESTSAAVRLMSERAIRRLPVVENNEIVGIVSLGDLALQLDRKSALADISAAPPNN
jgi:CBS domain-containing protein